MRRCCGPASQTILSCSMASTATICDRRCYRCKINGTTAGTSASVRDHVNRMLSGRCLQRKSDSRLFQCTELFWRGWGGARLTDGGSGPSVCYQHAGNAHPRLERSIRSAGTSLFSGLRISTSICLDCSSFAASRQPTNPRSALWRALRPMGGHTGGSS
ncbi:hypothetical protein C8R46DRAFT_490663 [Mycena filopes]|nr:hypothetical protein C8R46DRAFT_490663 [Mycena filopes]